MLALQRVLVVLVVMMIDSLLMSRMHLSLLVVLVSLLVILDPVGILGLESFHDTLNILD